jgi:hypothetical protein
MAERTQKRCHKCNVLKEISLFHKRQLSKDEYAANCKECVKKIRYFGRPKLKTGNLDEMDYIIKIVRANQFFHKYKGARISVHLELIWNFINRIN